MEKFLMFFISFSIVAHFLTFSEFDQIYNILYYLIVSLSAYSPLSDLESTQDARKKGVLTMSTLVLLNSEGVVVRKLQLISPPNTFLVPKGTTLSWRITIDVSTDRLSSWERRFPPVEAYFHLGQALGQINRRTLSETEYSLTISIQSASPKDIVRLRERILQIVESRTNWKTSNNLNPAPKRLWQQLKELFS